MDRRTFLQGTALMATIGSAGCAGSKTAVDTTTSTTTTSSTTTSTSTTQTTTTVKETTTSQSTTEQTTPPKEIAASKIKEAKTLLTEAITTYANFGGEVNASILNVTAATTSFDQSVIKERLSNVETQLKNAEPHSTDQQKKTIQNLRDVSRFLRYASLTESNLTSAYQFLKKASEALREARWGEVNTYGNEGENAGKVAGRAATTTANKSSAESTTAIDTLSKSKYESKISQLQQQADAVETLGKQFQRLESATKLYDEGIAAYNNEKDWLAKRSLGPAKEKFNTIVEAVKSQENQKPIAGLYSDVKCFSTALRDACKHFEKAAEASDSETRQKQERKGDNALRSCGLVEHVLGEVN